MSKYYIDQEGKVVKLKYIRNTGICVGCLYAADNEALQCAAEGREPLDKGCTASTVWVEVKGE